MVVGLGNPGAEYAHTRHNAGADTVALLAERHHGRLKAGKERSLSCEVRIDGQWRVDLGEAVAGESPAGAPGAGSAPVPERADGGGSGLPGGGTATPAGSGGTGGSPAATPAPTPTPTSALTGDPAPGPSPGPSPGPGNGNGNANGHANGQGNGGGNGNGNGRGQGNGNANGHAGG